MPFSADKNLFVRSPELEQESFFIEQYKKLLSKSILQGYYENDQEMLIDLKTKAEGEISFLKDVLTRANMAQKENPGKECVVLFDLDETLVKAFFDENNELEQYMRPCLPVLLDSLEKNKMKIGLLTSRGMVQEQIQETGELGLLGKYCDSGYIYSTRDYLELQREQSLIKDPRIINRPELQTTGNLEKIAFFDDLIVNNPEKVFVPIDDFEYPQLYQYGLALGDRQKFNL